MRIHFFLLRHLKTSIVIFFISNDIFSGAICLFLRNTVFLFFAFVSTAFYPAEGAPEPLATAFYLNPLTYLVDVIRAGIFDNITDFVIMEMLVLIVLAASLFIVATKLLTKLDF